MPTPPPADANFPGPNPNLGIFPQPQGYSERCADILLVDDTIFSLNFLAKVLEREGHCVRKATDGTMALAIVEARKPDLILLDVMMPGLSGYDVCRQLKAHSASNHVPIIFLSALSETIDKVRAFQVGAADYITKPFQMAEVRARINHQLQLAHLQRQLAQQNQRLRQEQLRSERLLYNLLPAAVADRLKQAPPHSHPSVADHFEETTILFADIADFTTLASTLPPQALVSLLNQIFSRFDQLATEYQLEKIKTIGDAYMVAGGIPHPRSDHACAVAHMALAMQRAITEFSPPDSCHPLRLRIGIHSGPVVAGVIGIQRLSYDLWGDTVNVASRMECYSEPGKIQVSGTTQAAIAATFQLTPRGMIHIKGKGPMETYWLTGTSCG